MLKKLLCWVIGHDTPPGSRTGLFSYVCFRCDTQVFTGPVKVQGDEWARKKYAERNDRPKYSVAA